MKKIVLISLVITLFSFNAQARRSMADTITVQELDKLISKDSIVDLGLSVNWANFNIGAKSYIDNGDYFAWGETEAKAYYGQDNSKNYGRNTYELKSDGIINENGELTPAYDAATVKWGSKYRMPNQEEVEELFSSCDIKGYIVKTEGDELIYGITLESRKNQNKIFFSFPGVYKESGLKKYDPNDSRPNAGACWASSVSNLGAADIASNIIFTTGWYFYRNVGLPIRPVVEKEIDTNADIWDLGLITSEMLEKQLGKQKTVDMGRGVKWTNSNLGAKNIYDNGDYFAWGETKPKDIYTTENCVVIGKDTAELANSKFVKRAFSRDDWGTLRTIYQLMPENDAATKILGKKFKTPDVDEMESLLYGCNFRSIRVKTPEGKILKGYLLKSKKNGNMLYFPIAGNKITTPNFNGIKALYWTSTMIENRFFYFDFSEMKLMAPYIGMPIRAIKK